MHYIPGYEVLVHITSFMVGVAFQNENLLSWLANIKCIVFLGVTISEIIFQQFKGIL